MFEPIVSMRDFENRAEKDTRYANLAIRTANTLDRPGFEVNSIGAAFAHLHQLSFYGDPQRVLDKANEIGAEMIF
jgi:hypothetical protein